MVAALLLALIVLVFHADGRWFCGAGWLVLYEHPLYRLPQVGVS